MTNESNEMPHPELVLRAAEEEIPPRLLDDYFEAIRTLREKKFTFREIAEWFGKFGFEVDHNAVYRAYAKNLSDYDAHLEAEADEELERDEAMRDAELNGTLRTGSATASETELQPVKKIEEPSATKGKKKKSPKGKGK